MIKAADERLDDYLKRLDQGDVVDGGTRRCAHQESGREDRGDAQKRDRNGAMLAELERTGESQMSLTDPDSRAMAAHTKVGVGYNVQIAVDAKNKMIVEQAVTNQVVDMGLLTQTAEPAREILDVEKIDVVADRAISRSRISRLARRRDDAYVPRPQSGPAVREGFFRKDEFRYDAEHDAYICPAGQVLATRYESKLREL